MATVSKKFLEDEIASLRQQQASALATAQQISGALAMAEHLLAKLAEAEGAGVSLDELAAKLGAKSAEVVPIGSAA